MSKELDKIEALAQRIGLEDRELVEDVLTEAKEYVAIVAEMGIIQMNLTCEAGDTQRQRVQNIDKRRTVVHDRFIDAVNIANRLADSIGAEPIYNGGSERREYGDFAFGIVKELFEDRK